MIDMSHVGLNFADNCHKDLEKLPPGLELLPAGEQLCKVLRLPRVGEADVSEAAMQCEDMNEVEEGLPQPASNVPQQAPAAIDWQDIQAALAAVRSNGYLLKDAIAARPDLQYNFVFVKAAVSNNWRMLQYASDDLRGDKTIVLAAMRNCGRALQHVKYGQLEDNDLKEVLVKAVRKTGTALALVPSVVIARLKDDDIKEIFMEAVKQDSAAMQHACEGFACLQGDPKQIVLEIVEQNGRALKQ